VKVRIAIWTVAGILVAGLWAIYIVSVSPEVGLATLRQPLVKALLYLSCPISCLGHYYPIHWTTVLLANGATYGLVGFMIEILHHRKQAPVAH
jgi:hypothetical protein